MNRTFCDRCKIEIGMFDHKNLNDYMVNFIYAFNFKVDDLCSSCWNELETLINDAVEKWKNPKTCKKCGLNGCGCPELRY